MTIPPIAASSASQVHAGGASHAHRHARPQTPSDQTDDTALAQATGQQQPDQDAAAQSVNLLV